MDLAYDIPAFLFRPLRDRTGIHEIDVCLLFPTDDFEAGRDESALVRGCLCIIEFAAQCQERYLHVSETVWIPYG